MAAPLLLLPLLLALGQLPSPSSGAQCPAFAQARLACSPSGCGHFVFRGKFELANSRAFRVAASPNGLRLGAKAAPADCCRQCRGQADCAFWSFFARTGACYLYTKDLCAADSALSPYVPNVDHAYVGGHCHDASEETASEAAASAADAGNSSFPLLEERSFCLLSDPTLHINMRLGGYMDPRVAPGQAPKPRVWIREIGIVWASPKDGSRHSLLLAGRRSPKQERGDGSFLDRIEVDGTPVPTMLLGDEVNLFDGEASILFDSYEKSGPVDVDRYTMRIEGLLEADLFARPAHPLLQHEKDAMVHLNLDIQEVQYTPRAHGVLGQTYHSVAKDKEESSLDYGLLSQLIGGSARKATAAGAKGKFSLEGTVEDYWSSSVLKPDCKFSQFGKALKLTPGEVHGDTEAKAGSVAEGKGDDDESRAALLHEAEELARELKAGPGGPEDVPEEEDDDDVAMAFAPGKKGAQSAGQVASS